MISRKLFFIYSNDFLSEVEKSLLMKGLDLSIPPKKT